MSRKCVVLGIACGLLVSLGAVNTSRSECTQPLSDLVSWWPGDGDATDTWDANHGTLQNGATFGVGKVGEAFSFDGVDDYVDVGDDLLSSTTGTIEAWIKLTSTSGSFDVFGIGKSQNNYFTVDVQGGGRLTHFVKTGGIVRWKYMVASQDAFLPEQWYHIALTHDGTKPRMYINGVETAQTLVEGSSSYDSYYIDDLGTGNNCFIGAGQQAAVINFYHGLIDEVGIYDRALTTAEIQDIFYAGSAGKCKIPLTPYEAIETLIDHVIDLNLKQGIENALDSKLDAALKSLEDLNANNNVAAINALRAFTNAVNAQRGSHIPEGDADVLIDRTLDVIAMLEDGTNPQSAVGGLLFPSGFGLQQNFPNPFSRTTLVRYAIPLNRQTAAYGAQVKIVIYDMTGRLVRTPVDQRQKVGYYTIEWDGRNDVGERVSDGVYFVRLVADNYISRQKMVLVR